MSLIFATNRTLLTKLVAAGTTYVFILVLARMMSVGEFGQVAFFLNTAMLLSVIGAGGQQMALLRFVPLLDSEARAALVWAAYMRAKLGTAIVYLGAVGVSIFAGIHVSLPLAALGFLLIPLVGWIDIQSSLARGLGRFQLSLVPKEIIWRAGTLVLVAGWFFVFQEVSAGVVLVCLAIVLAGLCMFQAWRLQVPVSRKPFNQQQWKSTNTPFWISSVANIFLANADVICVGVLLGARQAAVYFAANRLAQVLAFFTGSYYIVIAPKIAAAWYAKDRDQVVAILRETAVRTTVPTIAVGLFMYFMAPYAAHLFGSEFGALAGPLRVLIFAAIVNAALGPADIVLNMCGYERVSMHAGIACLVISAIALIFGALWAGTLGVAVGVLAATVFRKALYWGIVIRMMGIRCDVFHSALSRMPTAA